MAKPKQPRKEVVSFRLEPKIKYLVDIAARVQRRSPTNYIEFILEESLKNIDIEKNKSIYDAALELWATNEPDRVINLYNNYPNLLTHEENEIIEIINKHNYLFFNKYNDDKSFNMSSVSNYWEMIKDIANGDHEAESFLGKINNATMMQLFSIETRMNSDDNSAPSYDSYFNDSVKEFIESMIKNTQPSNRFDVNLFNLIIASHKGHGFLKDGKKGDSPADFNYENIAKQWVNLLGIAPFKDEWDFMM